MVYNPISTPAEPIPFLQAMLKAITGPNTANFHTLVQNPKASAGQGFLWVAISSAIGSLISGVLFTIFPIAANPLRAGPLLDWFRQNGGVDLPNTFYTGQEPFRLIFTLICGIPLAVILAVIGTAIVAGLIHLIASLLGGHGEYGKMVYMLALVQVPLGLVTSVLAPLPYLGCLSALISLYALVLEVLAIESVYAFGVAKAVLTLLIPLVVICLVFICLVAGVVAIFGVALRDYFQNNPGGLPVP